MWGGWRAGRDGNLLNVCTLVSTMGPFGIATI